MSQENNTTDAAARATVEPLNGRRYPATAVFQDMADDYQSGRPVWREVTPQFARYCREAQPPISGPEGSESFALGECHATTRAGAVHCVIAFEAGRVFARYVNLMRWAEELLDLRDVLSHQPAVCGMICNTCSRAICTGAVQIRHKKRRGTSNNAEGSDDSRQDDD